MVDKKIICPFCGKDISNTYRLSHSIRQEETIQREFTPGHTWAGNYIKETKYIRKFKVLCCEDCYKEYIKYDAIANKMASFAIPIGFVAGIAYMIYKLYFKNNRDFDFEGLIACIIYGIFGVFLFSIPTMIVTLTHRKKCSYKKAKECNANLG